MKIWKIQAIAFFALCIYVSLSSCNRSSSVEMLELVPDNVTAVKEVNLEQLLRQLGSPAVDADGNFTAEAERLIDFFVEPDYRAAFTALYGVDNGADFSRVVSFTTGNGINVVALPVVNRGALVSGLEHGFTPVDSADVNAVESCFAVDGRLVVVDNDVCWIIDDLRTLREVSADREKGHFGTLIGVREFLDGYSPAKLAVNCGSSSLSFLGDRSKWLCVDISVGEVSVSAQGVVMNRDGELDSIGRNFDVIDTDFLRYTPQDAAVVLAFGRFDGNVRGLSMLMGRFAPVYLPQADGTTSLYALPASGSAAAVADGVAGAWNVETMVHLPQSSLDEGLKQYRERAGGTARRLGDQWTYSEGGNSHYFGAFDGSLVFATNREISSTYNNSFTEDFEGKRAAMRIDIPAGSVLASAWGLSSGVSFNIALDATRVNARVTFNGTGASPLSALLSLPQLPDLRAKFHADTGRM